MAKGDFISDVQEIRRRARQHIERGAVTESYKADRETVIKVERMLHLAEYKRRQAAPGVKVTLRNFGRDRRYPIVNRFRDSGAPLPEPDRALVKNVAAKSEAFDF